MTKRAVGVGGKCCGDPEACDVGCFNAEPTTADLFDLETVADELGVDLFDEEDDE